MAKGKAGAKKRPTHKEIKDKGSFSTEGEAQVISAGVWGQLRPLDEKARVKTERWGDTLPDLVSPELAGRFEAAYEALYEKVYANDVVGTNQIASQLMRAWDVLESEAIAAGHQPLLPDGFCVNLGGHVTCFAASGVSELRKKHPDWVVYAFEDAARLLRHDWTEKFVAEAFKAFPEASVTRVKRPDEPVNYDLGGDDIPF
jgi:hypothetical protein